MNSSMNVQQLSSGLTLCYVPRDSPVTFFQLYTPFGGDTLQFSDEGKEIALQPGSAHYFEHVLFIMPPFGKNGQQIHYKTRTPKTMRNLRDGLSVLEQNKAIMVNAYTTHDHTNYLFLGRQNNLENLETMLDYVFTPYLPQDRFKKEVGTILDEARMYLNDSNSVHWDTFVEQIFHVHGARYPVIGTLESIPKISLEDVLSLHAIFYRPSNMTLVVTGRADMDVLISIATKKLEALCLGQYVTPPQEVCQKEPATIVIPNNFDHPLERQDVPLPNVLAGWKMLVDTRGKTSEELLDYVVAADLLNEILFGKGGKGREQLIKQGIDERSFSSSTTAQRGYVLSYVAANTSYPQKFSTVIADHVAAAGEKDLLHEEVAYARTKLLLAEDVVQEDSIRYGTRFPSFGVFARDSTAYPKYVQRLQTMQGEEIAQYFPEVLKPEHFTATLMVPKSTS